MKKIWLLMLSLVFVCTVTSGIMFLRVTQVKAAEITVNPGESIQKAIDDSGKGDIIIIHPGTYFENINFKGKAITVKSMDPNDPTIIESTIIDGNQIASVVTFNQGETSDSTLSGITVRNGKANTGGGILCKKSGPTITKCLIMDNSAKMYGGGILCKEAQPIIFACTITKNSANVGGGIACHKESQGTINDCAITENSASSEGGGIHCKDSALITDNCLVADNTATSSGGGIGLKSSIMEITNSTIAQNSTESCGGGIVAKQSELGIANTVVADNSAANGGGIHAAESNLNVMNCTITGNSANTDGGGIHAKKSLIAAVNCIFWADTPNEISAKEAIPGPAITYSNIQNGFEGVSNIDADPLFVDPAAGDYHLQSGSPCIDAGTDINTPPEDKDGNPRPKDGNGDGIAVSDMGAYEF